MKTIKPFTFIILASFLVACGVIGSHKITLSGTLELTEHSLGARVPGRITSLLVDEGSWVKKGDVIATLDRYEQTKRDYERVKSLYDKGGMSSQTLELAELDYQDQQVIAPVDGIILVKVLEAGDIVPAGGTVVVLGDIADRWVRVFVPEGSINRVHQGDEAKVRFDGFKKTFKGRITYISPKAEFTPRNVQTPEERVTQTFAIKVKLEDSDAPTYAGVSADVTLKLK